LNQIRKVVNHIASQSCRHRCGKATHEAIIITLVLDFKQNQVENSSSQSTQCKITLCESSGDICHLSVDSTDSKNSRRIHHHKSECLDKLQNSYLICPTYCSQTGIVLIKLFLITGSWDTTMNGFQLLRVIFFIWFYPSVTIRMTTSS